MGTDRNSGAGLYGESSLRASGSRSLSGYSGFDAAIPKGLESSLQFAPRSHRVGGAGQPATV